MANDSYDGDCRGGITGGVGGVERGGGISGGEYSNSRSIVNKDEEENSFDFLLQDMQAKLRKRKA